MGLAVALTAAGSFTAAAAETEIAANIAPEQVTVTATRTPANIADVPVTVSVISDVELDNHLVTNVKDLVRYEPGVSVRRAPSRFTAALGATGRDGNAGFNIRGLEDNRVLIQVDGIRVPDAFSFGAQAVGRGDYVDLDMLKSVEILRGPASALYGSDGLAGAVSFITKDPSGYVAEGNSFGAQGRVAYTSADQGWSENVVGAFVSGRWSGMVAYTRRDAHALDNSGEDASANTDRTTPNPQETSSNAVLAKLLFEPAEGHIFRLTYDHEDGRVNTHVLSAIAKPPLAASSTLDLIARDRDHRDRISFDHRFDNIFGFIDSGQWAAYWQDSTTRQFSAEDRNTSPDRTRINTFDNRVYGFSLSLLSTARTGALTHTFVYGGDISETHQEGVRDGTVPPLGETFPTRAFPTTDYELAGIYVQDKIDIGSTGLSLYPALRWDSYSLDPKPDAIFPGTTASQSDSHFSPKAGATYTIVEGLNAYVNYAQGFKAPRPSEVNNGFSNVVINYVSIPNPDLKPETSETWEGGLKYAGGGWLATGAIFTGTYDDFIEQLQIGGSFAPDDPAIFQYVNLSRVDISGAEAKVQHTFDSGFGFIAAASSARGTVREGGVRSPLNSVDPWKLVGGVSYNDPEGRFGGDITLTHSGRKQASRVDEAPCGGPCFRPDAFTTLDATAYWNVTDYATLRAGLFNITDEKYWWWSDVRGLSDASIVKDAYTQPGRNFSVSLTVRM